MNGHEPIKPIGKAQPDWPGRTLRKQVVLGKQEKKGKQKKPKSWALQDIFHFQ